MRSLSESEITQFLKEWTWGTLIAIEDDKPYAVELSYATDGKYLFCGSMPDGRMSQCVKDNTNVVFKVCESSKDTTKFRAVIVEGVVKKLTQREEIMSGLRVLYKKLELPESRIKPRTDQLMAQTPKSSFYRITIKAVGGRALGY